MQVRMSQTPEAGGRALKLTLLFPVFLKLSQVYWKKILLKFPFFLPVTSKILVPADCHQCPAETSQLIQRFIMFLNMH